MNRFDLRLRGLRPWLLAAVVLLLVAVPAQAREDYDDDADSGNELPNYALGFGFGLVDPDGDVETYLTAGLRIRLGDHDREVSRASTGGIRGYLEPEVGYWESDTTTDTLLGVNLIGLVPFRAVDYHFGVGVGYHFFDVDVFDAGAGRTISQSDERLGMNAQFGIDLRMTDTLSLFGTARFDLVEDSDDEVQDKLYLGLRFNF